MTRVAARSRCACCALVLAALALGGRGASAAAQTAPLPAAGFQISAQLEHAAYVMRGAPSVVVHAPAGFDASKPLQLVVFLHGYSGCVSVLMARGPARCRPDGPLMDGWDLGRYHDAAHTNTLFVVPQLAYMKRDGRPGEFARRGGFRDFLQELLGGPLAGVLGGARGLPDIARIDLVAHSAGYQTALAILERGGLAPSQIRSVVLLDALYAEAPRFARYVEAHRPGLQLVVISLPHGIPERHSRWLERRLRQTLGAQQVINVDPNGIADAIANHPIVFARGTPPHRSLPQTHLAQVLSALHSARLR